VRWSQDIFNTLKDPLKDLKGREKCHNKVKVMPSNNKYKEPRTCNCGYSTMNSGNWSTHKKSCRLTQSSDNELILTLKEQLATKDQQMKEQLEAKDRQIAAQAEEIKMLIKKPRTVTNNNTTNRYVVEQQINVFGKETLSHISQEQIQSLLADPENAVAKFVKLKHRAPSNANVRCPNVNRAIYQVVVDTEGEEKEWENRPKGEVLEKLYDDNSTILEGEAVEEDHTPFLDHQDKVKASAAADAADGGRCYKQQLDKIHNVIIS
jgi:hypothetical protein